ncbi:MAG: class A sortase [Streptococcaceae bacterium]|nr:class A sortase [Streptococcaceae bacterium]
MKRKLKTITICFILVFFLFFIFNHSIRNIFISENIDHYALSKYSIEDIEKNQAKDGHFDFSNTSSLSLTTVLSVLPKKLLVVGAISVPDLSIDLPIFLGVDNSTIATGAGTMKAYQEMGKGNYALASHNLIKSAPKLLFSPLTKAKAGMAIYLTDKSEIYQYKIVKIETVKPDQIDVIENHSDQKEVTLVLCSDEQETARLIIHGDFVKSFAFSAKQRIFY